LADDLTLADQDWIGLMIFKKFADQDWIVFNFIGSGLDSDWKILQSAHLWCAGKPLHLSRASFFCPKLAFCSMFKALWKGYDCEKLKSTCDNLGAVYISDVDGK